MIQTHYKINLNSILLTNSKNIDVILSTLFQGGLFESSHTDENDVQTISHVCRVLPLKDYTKASSESSGNKRKKSGGNNGSLYYLAGNYDPLLGHVTLSQGVQEVPEK